MNTEPFVSTRVLNVVLATAEELGVANATALRDSGLTPVQLSQENFIASIDATRAIIFNCLKHIDLSMEEFTFTCGQNSNLNSYGPVGLAAMSEKTFGDTIEVVLNYFELILPSFTIEKREENNFLTVTLIPKVNLSINDYTLLLCFILGSCKEMVKTLTGETTFAKADIVSINLPIPEVSLLLKDKDLAHFSFNFESEFCSVSLPIIATRFPIVLANRFAAEKFKKECEKILKETPLQFSSIIRKKISETEYHFPTLSEIAQELNISSRSLHRALIQENTSYRNILINVKMSKAAELLKSNEHSITDIADKLGYSDSANFSKSFKAFYGVTPKQYL